MLLSAIQHSVNAAVVHMGRERPNIAPELTEQISQIFHNSHPQAGVAWGADDPHYLAANVVHDDEEGFERRCVLEHLSLRRNSQDGGSVCLSAT